MEYGLNASTGTTKYEPRYHYSYPEGKGHKYKDLEPKVPPKKADGPCHVLEPKLEKLRAERPHTHEREKRGTSH